MFGGKWINASCQGTSLRMLLEHGGLCIGDIDIRNFIAMSCTLEWLKTINAGVICHST